MALTISTELKLHFMLSGLVGSMFEEADCGISPSNSEILKDYKNMQYELVLEFSAGFQILIKVPYHEAEDSILLQRFSSLQKALSGASVSFPQDMHYRLELADGSHCVAVIGGYAHGEVVKMNISKPTLLVAASDHFSHLAGPCDLETPIPAVTTIPYDLAKFRGGGVPTYILHPRGECPSLEFVESTFKEFPMLGLLPASQGFIYTDTAFLQIGTYTTALREEHR